jgi:L-fucose mutarotase
LLTAPPPRHAEGHRPALSAEIVHVLMLMGHGDDLVICDVNHPAATIAAETTYGRLSTWRAATSHGGAGDPVADAAGHFVPAPVWRMQVVGNPDGVVPIFAGCRRWWTAPRVVPCRGAGALRLLRGRQAGLCIIRTSDPGPYGCFILKKGVI